MKKDDACAVCGKMLPHPQERFVVDLRGYAWPEIPDVDEEAIEKDLEAEMAATLERLKHAGLEEMQELEAEAFFECSFVLCRECYRRYTAHPVPEKRELYAEEEPWA